MTVGATKELRLSVDKKRKHILCRSRPQPPLLLPLVHYYGVVEQKNALCDGGRMQCTEAPFLPQSLVFLEKSTSNCSLWFVPKMCVHCKLQFSTMFENLSKSLIQRLLFLVSWCIHLINGTKLFAKGWNPIRMRCKIANLLHNDSLIRN